MRLRVLISIALLFAGAASSRAYTTTTMYTATGYPVTVYHNLSCPSQVGCPATDSAFEAAWGFRSVDRWYSGTTAWNCHGRTFDNRQGWVSYADPWMTYDAPVCPASPRPGDTVIWWGTDGRTAHSVTITSAWNGLSTIVMSKYGSQGQYQHALSNPIVVYGSNWSVIRFTAGTTIYYYGTAIGDPKQKLESPAERFLAERETKPWFNTVKASEVLYATEHPRIVARSTALKEATRLRLLATENPEEQATLLLQDLADPSHSIALSPYSGPQFTEEFVTGIEAGKLLVLLGEQHPELRHMLADHLATLVKASDAADVTRGAAVYFLGKIAPEDATNVKAELESEQTKAVMPGYTTYLNYYLRNSPAAE